MPATACDMDPFDQLTDRARRAISLACGRAGRDGCAHVGTAHLLPGLLGVPDGLGTLALQRIGVDVDALRLALGDVDAGEPLPPTDQLVALLASARDEALRFQRARVGTEHLLLALARVDDGRRALERVGVDDETVLHGVIRVVAGPGRRTPEVPARHGSEDPPGATSVLARPGDERRGRNAPSMRPRVVPEEGW